MKKILSTLVALMCLAVMPAASQTVTTTPATVTRSATDIVITFHADEATRD